ncbi:unnamed protein product, partial [Laminaria digitata]
PGRFRFLRYRVPAAGYPVLSQTGGNSTPQTERVFQSIFVAVKRHSLWRNSLLASHLLRRLFHATVFAHLLEHISYVALLDTAFTTRTLPDTVYCCIRYQVWYSRYSLHRPI